MTIRKEVEDILAHLGVPATTGNLTVRTPITGEVIAQIATITPEAASKAIAFAHTAFLQWRLIPAPRRGELVRLLGEELRAQSHLLGRLVTIETGKILSEGHGEVQEMIDICTFAAGLSRQLAGLTVPSERAKHRMMETWHPLGVVGIISAFNFPVAVWSWNAALALVCGNAVVWKPSERTPLTALATQAIFERAAEKFAEIYEPVPEGLSTLLIGDAKVGEQLVDSPLIPLVSATGSTTMGRAVAPKLAARFAKAILELGGNNAAIVAPTADLDLTLRAIAFSAMGTAGQRCTTLRRLIVNESVYDKLIPQLKKVYGSVVIGDPGAQGTLVGPLIDERSYTAMQKSLEEARSAGAAVTGGERIPTANDEAFYVRPALVEIGSQTDTVKRETFAPILYVLKYSDFADALALHNDVPQGLSSSIFTMNLREAELFLSATGSDCGIANVNIGTSGAEIGGAFGGEKETGGGRESGSDAWKAYMRRATNTINYGTDLPLAQGVSFDID
ncbi:aldehyde dehydrogenase family protein [Tunturiibacter gelidoferens]|uniref:aldehyde dehydrogenase (NAD(+)) n=2 Tax=Tunturiibacter TaxID=3154218 RepID=A0A7Y9NJ23_9BACT|nr:aldehyde dehydrogenase family protein [Edaphobacter lichenicola]MBB5340470.1 aldehyde dehydrogenase (NAD+) [Edaphobacter lichenicola]NYF50214.1 aldehyde dehydrogenase (NAD+) [Edaphobacter lichenicola]